ncbi:glycoside hydrolase superfamily [Tricharina praecox]|uniref:glycoside hydrolase superfamily n=1 Tax=Tricharina praecox TaxID=43433 RepID=UPI00221ED558|nr:glycoside hydrolase superfamily [Tricharina praecox]KAI5845313.1 glycoside hydrolase superfamily [Tricharina praecox]
MKLSLNRRKPRPHPAGIPIYPDRTRRPVFALILQIFGVKNYDQIWFDFRFEVLRMFRQQPELWPLEIPSMPELAEKGAYAPGFTYSPEDLQQILDYAEARGIQVIVEIDMPGHSTCCRKTWGMKERFARLEVPATAACQEKWYREMVY